MEYKKEYGKNQSNEINHIGPKVIGVPGICISPSTARKISQSDIKPCNCSNKIKNPNFEYPFTLIDKETNKAFRLKFKKFNPLMLNKFLMYYHHNGIMYHVLHVSDTEVMVADSTYIIMVVEFDTRDIAEVNDYYIENLFSHHPEIPEMIGGRKHCLHY